MKFPHHASNEGGYLNTLHYTDWAIGQFFETIREKPWFENTVFFITADHVLPHFNDFSFEEKFKVPLIMLGPGLRKARTEDQVSSHLDLMPTIADILHIQSSYSSIGESLLRKKERFAFVVEGSNIGIISDRGYLKHSTRRRLEAQLFDPNERKSTIFENFDRQDEHDNLIEVAGTETEKLELIKSSDPKETAQYLMSLERRLLATDQLIWTLLRKNRWTR